MNSKPPPNGGAAPVRESPPTGETEPGLLQRVLHLFALSSLTVAQPILDLLGRNDEFFVIRHLDRIDITGLIVGLLIVVPLPFVAIEVLMIRAPQGMRRTVHLAFMFFFGTLFGMLAIKRFEALPAGAVAVLAAVLGAVLAILYARTKAVRAFVGMLAIALVLVPTVFVANPQVARLLKGRYSSTIDLPRLRTTAPIVFVIFDEFSQAVLLDADLRINRHRYPNLAGLAGTSTWYRNAIAAAENTASAVPAILTAIEPIAGQVPSALDHPNNLFTAFGGSYDLWVEEPATQLCPPEINRREVVGESRLKRFGLLASDLRVVYLHLMLPAAWSRPLPGISSGWSGFGRAGGVESNDAGPKEMKPAPFFRKAKQATREDRRVAVDRFVSVASKISSSKLLFLHLMLPHRPWDLLPDGRRYPVGSFEHPGLDRAGWSKNRYLSDQALQRYILQLMYLDRAVGRLVASLKDSGRFDETLMVLVADHGFSFTPGEHQRLVSERNAHEILLVPLIIKAPHQTDGLVVDQRVSTLDVLPTVLEILGEQRPWPMNGVSRATAAGRPPAPVRIFSKERGPIELDPSVLRKRRRFVRAMLKMFGDGSDPDDIYRFGPYPELLGTPTKDFEVLNSLDWHLQIEDAEAYRDDRSEASVLPAFLRATVRPPHMTKPGQAIAVSLNGVVVSTAVTFAVGGGRLGITAMLPPSAFQRGGNEVEVFQVVRDTDDFALRKLQLD